MEYLNSLCRPVLRQKWLVIALVVLTALWLELIEHRPDINGLGEMFDLDLLVYALVVPLLLGIVLTKAQVLVGDEFGRWPVGAAVTMKTKPTRIMVVNNHGLMSAGIITLLAGERDLMVETVDMGNEASMVQAIRGARPDAVLIDTSTPLSVFVSVFQALDALVVSRVVLVSADSNQVVIYRQGHAEVRSADDLVEILQTG